MNENVKNIMQGMINILNLASEKYYNTDTPIMSDKEFDERLEDLRQLEKETGIVMSNSPTQNVGAKVLTDLNKVKIEKPMLSLEKVHTAKEIIDFSDCKDLVAMIKCDGLSTRLIYKDGVLISANTRGTGFEGSDITDHVKQFLNVPLHIDFKDTLIVDGESIIKDNDFKIINKDNQFKNSRNTSAGTLSLLDTSIVKERRLSFIAWDVIEGIDNDLFSEKLSILNGLGFEVVPYEKYDFKTNIDKLEKMIDFGNSFIFDKAKEVGICCDGVVWKYDSVSYGDKKGKTSHHFCNAVAYKKKDNEVETTLKDIEWQVGKTGIISPIAVFKSVEIEGSIVEKSSMHNVSVLIDVLGFPFVGQTIYVSKRNSIIPYVERADKIDEMDIKFTNRLLLPKTCPICGGNTEISSPNLICTNPNCKGKLLGKLKHFVSKSAMDIGNLSEASLEKFINEGFVESFIDIYELKNNFEDDVKHLEGFGEKSANKLFKSIEDSKRTTLDRFINALSIPTVGKEIAKAMAKRCDYEFKELLEPKRWDTVEGIGFISANTINKFIYDNRKKIEKLASYMIFEKPKQSASSVDLSGKVFVVTGRLNIFENRDAIKEKIEELGGKVSGSISSKTNYLINNDINSISGKNKKAKELGVEIINEEQLIAMLN